MNIGDIFGNGQGLRGLLSEEDIGSAQNDALMRASMALLKAGSPQARRVGLGEALSDAYDAGTKGYAQGINGALQQQQIQQKVMQAKQEQAMRERLSGAFSGASGVDQKIAAYRQAAEIAAANGNSEAAKRYAEIADSMMPKVQDGYTLSPGQTRFGPDGKPVASLAGDGAKFSGEYGNLALALFGTSNAAELTPDQRKSLDAEAYRRQISKPPTVSVAVDTRDPTAVGKAALSFQKDFRDATKPSYARAAAYNAMLEASKDPSPKGDLTMVYSLVKAYDPESVVREGEIDLLNANRSVPDRIKGYAERLATGKSLLPQERQDMLQQARTLSFTDYKRSRNDIKAFRDNAGRLGLDPDLYAPDPYQGIDFGPRKLGDNPQPSAQPGKAGAKRYNPATGRIE